MRLQLNEMLPKDVTLFSVLPVAARFDSKINTSHREYSYFLPTYMLMSIKEMCLESPPKTIEPVEGQEHVTQMSSGIKKILRRADAGDEHEDGDKFLDRDLSHITEEMHKKMEGNRMSDEHKELLQKLWRSFIGTRKYHNYTKEVKAH